MSQREQLVENFEDAFIALFMSDVAEHEGEKIIEENEELKRDASFALPPELEDRCLKTISKADRRKRGSRAGSAGKKIYGVFSKLSVAAVIAMALFTTAYAAFPEVRVSTLNLLIEVSDIATELSFGDVKNSETDELTNPGSESDASISGYLIPDYVVANYKTVDKGNNQFASWASYSSSDGSTIDIEVQNGSDTSVSINTEDADETRTIKIGDFQAIIALQNNGVVHAGVADTSNYKFIIFTFNGVDFNTSVSIVTNFLEAN